MKIALITGGSGHVGANLVRELTKRDFKVRCIDFDGDHRAFEGYDVEQSKETLQILNQLIEHLRMWMLCFIQLH